MTWISVLDKLTFITSLQDLSIIFLFYLIMIDHKVSLQFEIAVTLLYGSSSVQSSDPYL